MADILGTAYTKPEFVGVPVEHLLWTMVLPGFVEARQSAFDAWMQSEAELPYWREMAHAPDEAARAEIVARHQTNLNLGAPKDIAAKLLRHAPAARAYRVLAEASRNAERGKPHPEFAYDFKRYVSEVIPRELGSSDEIAESWTLIAGRRSSTVRRLLIACWIHGGLWLMVMPDIAAFLATRKANLPEMRSLPEPSAEALRVWKSDLNLRSYAGNGRLRYNQAGLPKLDVPLKNRVYGV